MTLAHDTAGFSSRFVEVASGTSPVRLHVLEGGPADGPLVVLLHGFPEMHLAWRHQLQPLASAGFHVVAPDLRGYHLSDKPRGRASYTLDVLQRDVVALVDAIAPGARAHIAGHDWGGVVAWALAHAHPERVETLTILNAPHPRVFLARLRGIEQLAASWYVALFQLPFAERLLARDNFALLERVLRAAPRIKGAYDDEDIAAYRRAWSSPGALTAMLSWYRALTLGVPSTSSWRPTVRAPTLVLWGMDDEALPPGNLEGLERFVEDLKIVRLPNCSHWVMHDAPRIVNRELLALLAR